MEATYIDRIRRIKSEKKITNEQLSEMTGIAISTLSKILAGFSDSPKLSNICAICQALDCSVEYILTGVPDNTNNYTLEEDEIDLIEQYRTLDEYGKKLVAVVIDKEAERVEAENGSGTDFAPPVYGSVRKGAVKKPLYSRTAASVQNTGRTTDMSQFGKRSLMMYDMPVSAGTGVYLDQSTAVEISIPYSEKTATADYALRISGNSMEPKFRNGDVLLIEECETVEVGELGIFILDGNGYFKMYNGDSLLSLNREYQPIQLKDFQEVQCVGRVVGKLKRK